MLNTLLLLSFSERFNMFIDKLGFILLILVCLTLFVVSLSSAFDVFDAKDIKSGKKYLLILLPTTFASLLYLLLLINKVPYLKQFAFIFLFVMITYNTVISIILKNHSGKTPKLIYKSAYRPKELLIKFLLYAEIIFVITIVLVPIVYVIGSALNPRYGISTSIWPKEISLDNFKLLFEDTANRHYLKWYWSTFKIAVLTMVFSVLLSTTTAYIFSRYKFKGKKWGLIALLVLQMFPSFMGLIAIFTLYKLFNLLNNPIALVIVYSSGQIPYNTWLIKGYLSGIPRSLDESARIDGANGLQIFTKIIFPLAVPILTFVAVTQFMSPWMDYILPSFLLFESDKYTLAVGLFNFVNSRDNQNYTLFAAGSLLVAVPIGTLYLALQRFLIEGITAGANKG